jgi:signal transduction histidine kinase
VSDIPAQLRLGLRDLGVQMRAVMFAPLQFRDVRLGVMFACHRIDGPQFCAEDEPRLLAAATGAATAVATAQPIERERLRITLHGPQRQRRSACELEDQQLLRALGRLRQAIAAAHRKRDLAVWQLTGAEAIEQIEQQIASLRATIGARHATELDDLGLVAALRALVDRTRAQTGVQIIVRLQIPATDSDQVPGRGPELEAVAYEIVHQALEDAAVLAQANRVKVAVLLHNNALQITVRDDGGATDRELSRSDVGLPGMREQIALLGGTLQITSDGAGTAVIATLPLGPAAAAGRATKG